MKSIDELNALDQERLEAISDDESLGSSDACIRGMLDKLELASELKDGGRRTNRIRLVAGIAASAILAITIGLTIGSSGPEDTFDDPALAYAQVQEVFRMIGSGVQQSKDAVGESGQTIYVKVEETINKVIK